MMGPDKRKGPEIAEASGAENAEAGNLSSKHTTLLLFPRNPWRVPMLRARAIGRHRPGPLKDACVRRWRVAVQNALGEVRE